MILIQSFGTRNYNLGLKLHGTLTKQFVEVELSVKCIVKFDGIKSESH